ncbi:uncharacterized protein TRIREDRAFT_104118 [Trichoderma reesei QM6a]|uniref:Predicted protein n=2 Tax=Hypocrea jecorina TaxID=51453 RepID=G0RBH6_HYPJQ|nr:uncharacterized protein TRIREDRAFT_104118 [Trichoderma reesei QM6a]EGR51328.1 predicted protein [Trichoderma reesei QM6a]ETS04821.1 hypothetical protein M419DRAFT_73223 [Trichoderma reesei RUT C-30]
MAQKTTDFGNFVDQVLVNVFFQPDDELSLNTVAETFSPDFTATINGVSIPGEAYKQAIVESRAKSTFKVVKTEEILASHDADREKGGSVAHYTEFLVIDKETGVEKKEATLTIVTCVELDGKVVLKSLTEVYHK